jgi:hypothetical protein
MRRFVISAFAVSVLAACQPATTELTDELKSEIEAAVRTAAEDLWAGASEADMEHVLSHWRQQDGFCLMNANLRMCPEVLEAYRAAWNPDREVRLERQEADGVELWVVALSPTVALMARKSVETRGYYTNGEVTRASFANFAIFVLEDGEWKAHSMQQASWPIEEEEG